MAYLVIGDERVALQIGDNILGGASDDSVAAPELVSRTPFAMISVYLEVVTTIRRVPGASVAINGKVLGDEPVEIRHGARIENAGLTILFGDLRSVGSTTRVRGITDDELSLAVESTDGDVAGDTGGVLLAVNDGQSYTIPAAGLTIGRDPSCGLVLSGRNVSRVHAMIAPSLRGYTIADHGINGVIVNGGRVDGSRVLRRGDVIRIGDDDFRFDADAASFEPSPLVAGGPLRALKSRPCDGAEDGGPSGAAGVGTTLREPGPTQPLSATLEVITDGALRGTRFRIQKALAHIGRADHNDIRLVDGSVSGSHATLLHRGGCWHLSDLESTNGTYVDGERLIGETALNGPAEIRVGDIRMVFRPIAAPPMSSTTRGIVGVTEEQARKGRRSPA